MKKGLIILVFAILTMCMSAQAEHLKFMGIPLTGTITQFQQKLAAKGVKYDKKESEIAEIGTRCFQGTFAGTKAHIAVWYESGSKIVYGAKAVFFCSSASSRDSKYDELKSLLLQKYPEEEYTEPDKNGLEALQISVTSEDGNEVIGSVTLFRSKDDYYYDNYYVHVEYIDMANFKKNENSKMNDL